MPALPSGSSAAPGMRSLLGPPTVFLEDRSFLVLFSGYPLKEEQVAHFSERIFFPKKLIFFFFFLELIAISPFH